MKLENFFCDICGNYTQHISIENIWTCCACNPCLRNESEFMGLTTDELINIVRIENGQERSIEISQK